MTTYINIGSKNIKFVAGKTYKIGASLIVTAAQDIAFDGDITGARVTNTINQGYLTVVSGTIGQYSYTPEVVYVPSTSTGFVEQVEGAVAALAARDVTILKKVAAQNIEIMGLRQDVNGKAAIDDASTGTDKVLSASKTIALIGAAKTDLENFANSAASGIIDDASSAANKVWSASKAALAISNAQTAAQDFATTAITNLIGGASGAADTLKELETLLSNEGSAIAALTTSVCNKVSFAVDQSTTITSEQKAIARTNIGAITAGEATTIANDRITAVIGDFATFSVSAILASLPVA